MTHDDTPSAAEVTAARKQIQDMIEASMDLSVRKGPHPLTEGCNCIVCVNKRKMTLSGQKGGGPYRL